MHIKSNNIQQTILYEMLKAMFTKVNTKWTLLEMNDIMA